MHLAEKLRTLGVDVAIFREPDIDNQVTGISFVSSEKTKKVTRGLPLLLKQFKNQLV